MTETTKITIELEVDSFEVQAAVMRFVLDMSSMLPGDMLFEGSIKMGDINHTLNRLRARRIAAVQEMRAKMKRFPEVN
jgi:hypothetical protein